MRRAHTVPGLTPRLRTEMQGASHQFVLLGRCSTGQPHELYGIVLHWMLLPLPRRDERWCRASFLGIAT